ncbi:MAG: RecX family transcriptional regulator [Candidatus Peribacteria bacterium]|jgi:SOS response regulatory protein OraA/RecX|nr:RecX family transcriptional regulator [Candidatus Peribacteria bacterium]
MLYIKQKLYERQEPKELVEKFLEESYLDFSSVEEEGEDQFWELKNLKKEYEKLKGKYEDKKIIEKLLRKGFMYDDIKKIWD